jgi:hypothetical protein
MRNAYSAGVLYACKVRVCLEIKNVHNSLPPLSLSLPPSFSVSLSLAHTLFTAQREREIKREIKSETDTERGGRERERGR